MKRFLLPLVAIFFTTILDAKNPFETDYDKSVFIRSLIRQAGVQIPASLRYTDAYEKTKRQRTNPKLKETLTTIFELFYKQGKRPPVTMADIENAKSAAKKKSPAPEISGQESQLVDSPKTPTPLDVDVASSSTSRESGIGFAASKKNSSTDSINESDRPKSFQSHFSFDDEEASKGSDNIEDYPRIIPEKQVQNKQIVDRINLIQEELNRIKRDIGTE